MQGDVIKCSIKTHILKLIRPQPKSFYNIHDPIGLHYIFQLRTGLSPLRCHKFRHNFQDTPDENCICNHGFEDISHFLFTCLNFTIHRASRAVDITNILGKYNLLNLANNAEFYLYGHRDLSSEDNKKVLSRTYQIHKKQRKIYSVTMSFLLPTPPPRFYFILGCKYLVTALATRDVDSRNLYDSLGVYYICYSLKTFH